MVRELQRQLLEYHNEDLSLTGKLMTVLAELRGLAYKLDIMLARLLKDFKHLPIPQSLKEIVSPEGMAYSIPDIPLPGTSKSGTDTPKRIRSPKLEEGGSVSSLAEQVFADEPQAKRINWSYLPNPNSIQENHGQTLVSQMHHVTGGNGLLNGRTVGNANTSFTVQSILEKTESSNDSTLSESRFTHLEHASEYGHFSIAHIFTQPLKFSRELESEPMIASEVDCNVQQDPTERVITYENL